MFELQGMYYDSSKAWFMNVPFWLYVHLQLHDALGQIKDLK